MKTFIAALAAFTVFGFVKADLETLELLGQLEVDPEIPDPAMAVGTVPKEVKKAVKAEKKLTE